MVDWTVFVDKPFFDSKAEIQDAKDAYKSVLSDVGANLPYFDEHDMRMVSETYNGTTSTRVVFRVNWDLSTARQMLKDMFISLK